MSPSADEKLNAQAATAAGKALSDPVEAATRCEQVTQFMAAEAAGVGKATVGMAKFGRKLGGAMMPSVGKMAKGLEGGGLPKSFILAVTATQVHAIEEKESKGDLSPGEVLRSFDREGFMAKLEPGNLGKMQGVPEDRQVLVLYLPLDGSQSKYLKAAEENISAAGSPGMPTKFMIPKDDAAKGVVDAIVQAGSPTVTISGGTITGLPGQTDSTSQLEKLAELHEKGVLSDKEFETQKAKIIGS